MNCSEMCSILPPCFFFSLLWLVDSLCNCKIQNVQASSTISIGIHEDRWSNSKLEVQELDSLKKCSLSDVLQVLDDLIVMGARNNGMHESWWSLCRMHCSFRILFPYEDIVICYKRNAMFCSYRRQFSKDNFTFGSQTSIKSFRLDEMKKKHETSDVHFIVDV